MLLISVNMLVLCVGPKKRWAKKEKNGFRIWASYSFQVEKINLSNCYEQIVGVE